jgi:hypothetical protein
MRNGRWSVVTVSLGAAIVSCAVAGSALAAVNGGGPSTAKLARRYCAVWGPPNQAFYYGQDASYSQVLRSDGRTLARSSEWYVLGEDLMRLGQLGASSSWTASQSAAFRADAKQMYDVCRANSRREGQI